MAWLDIQRSVRSTVRQLQQQKYINATIAGTLGSVPIVGSFLNEIWKAADGSDEQKAAMLAKILVTVSDSEERFKRFEDMVGEQGEQLKALLQYLRVETVAQAIAFNLTVDSQRERSRDLIERATTILEAAGQKTEADDYFRLGYANMAMHRPDDAKACFLEALNRDKNCWKALLGISNVYQVQGNTMIRQGYLQAAEDALAEARRYAEEAAKYDQTSPAIRNQLGYIEGTLSRARAGSQKKE